MSLCAAFDSAGEDWCALYASGSDAPNLFGTTGLDTSALERRALGVGAAVSAGTAFTRYSDDRAKYGKGRIVLDTGTTLSVRANIGYDGVTFDYSAGAPTTLTGVVWVRLQTGTSASTFRLDVAGPGANVTTGAAVTLTTTWQRLATTHTWAVGTGGVYLEVRRASGTDDINVEIAGAMLVSGSAGPTYLNGGADTLAGVLTDYWGGGKWGLGFVKPYQYVAPVGKAELILNNHDKRFSPEYSSGPLYGELLPNRLVQIGDPNYGIWWTGWVDSWAPEPGADRDKKAKLSATDARRFLSRSTIPVPFQAGFTEDERVADVLETIELPNTTAGIPTTSDGDTEWYPLSDGAHSVPTGDVGGLYGTSFNNDPVVSEMLADMMTGVQGRVWCGRQGGVRARLTQGDDTPANYVDIAQNWLDIGYENGQVVNYCEVIIFKVKGETGTFTVWELDETTSVPSGSTESFRVYFTEAPDNKIRTGADTLTLTHAPLGGGRSSSLTNIGLQSAQVNLINGSGGALNFTSADITATTIATQFREVGKEYEDSTSITTNGRLEQRIRSPYVQANGWGKRLARYIVTRFKDARNEVPWVDYDVDKNPQDAFDCYVGASVRVQDDQTDHDDYYAVIGELHTVRDGRTDHTVKLYLEPLYSVSVADTSSS
jgi:hypothetical protein